MGKPTPAKLVYDEIAELYHLLLTENEKHEVILYFLQNKKLRKINKISCRSASLLIFRIEDSETYFENNGRALNGQYSIVVHYTQVKIEYYVPPYENNYFTPMVFE